MKDMAPLIRRRIDHPDTPSLRPESCKSVKKVIKCVTAEEARRRAEQSLPLSCNGTRCRRKCVTHAREPESVRK